MTRPDHASTQHAERATGRCREDELMDRLFEDVPGEDMKTLDDHSRKTVVARACAAVTADLPGLLVEAMGDATLVVVTMRNRPFILDSILAETGRTVAGRGPGALRLVAHPIVEREGGEPVSLVVLVLDPMDSNARTALEQDLRAVMAQITVVTDDWKAMEGRLKEALDAMRQAPPPVPADQLAEAVQFVEWLLAGNMTLIGIRDYEDGGERLIPIENSGMGILRDPGVAVMNRGGKPVTLTPQIRAFLDNDDPLIITKANLRSRVHRTAPLDYVGLKRFGVDGQVVGETRVVGLFTSTAYTRSLATIPVLRHKAAAVLERFGADPESHTGKSLTNVLETWPRDELFQTDIDTLADFAGIAVRLEERPRVRVLARPDGFDRFVSVLAYVPRERYDSAIREKMGAHFAEVFDGHLSAFYPAFLENGLVRVHFIVGRSGGTTPRVERADLEAAVTEMTRSWQERVRAAAEGQTVREHDFPLAYQEHFTPEVALRDAAMLEGLDDARGIAIDFHAPRDESRKEAVALKLFHLNSPIALSRRVPMLENLGFRVIDEISFPVMRDDGKTVHIHEMLLMSANGEPVNLADRDAPLEQALRAVWAGEADDDGFNALVLNAGLDVDRAAVFRAYARYLRQVRSRFTPASMARTLSRYPAVVADLDAFFAARFDPESEADASGPEASVMKALETIASSDDDRIIRNFANLISATLRTNFYAPAPEGTGTEAAPTPVLAFKIDPAAVTIMPAPVPYREIFVSSPQVEGLHLRFGPVARGGLRWSDRAQDYRTEVLGLVKAQQVKNAVIVPVGSKGGFVPKHLPSRDDRDRWFEAGRDAYKTFISSLLSLTDNLVDGKVVGPQGVVRHDGDDPYFVVAADKGTSTFSDTANAISQAYGYWLDDAFASGGSAGYDHKKMGITARGGWEAVKRHFREMEGPDGGAWNIQTEPFTAAGVGDMSGDVFGNGMLLSEQTRLIAAFDHRDIFIDPEPDAATSFAERKRLFEMPRSSWQDYDEALISKGGGVFSRTAKTIALSEQAAAAIGFEAGEHTPQEIMSAILKAPVDLLWFGGIGTYIRASTESDLDADDRSNDAIRITARDLRAKVMGEGANLGLTQRARIEFNRLGGRSNSDAIDNSAGVNSSDVEVNIKIALAAALASGRLDRAERDTLLESMTEEVAALVLRNNYLQTLAISLEEQRGQDELQNQARMMTALETRGLLDRAVEDLPDAAALDERRKAGEGLTRAEIGVLLAYAKIVALDDLVASNVPDDAWLEDTLLGYFPTTMQTDYGDEIHGHRLKREIVSTVLANAMINRGGPTFIAQVEDRTGAPLGTIAPAYLAARYAFSLEGLDDAIDGLDNEIAGEAQLGLYAAVRECVMTQTVWFTRYGNFAKGIAPVATRYRKAVETLMPKLDELLPTFLRERIAADTAAHEAAGIGSEVARSLARLPVVGLIPDIRLAADGAGAELVETAEAFFAVTETFRVGRIVQAARGLETRDHYDALALDRALQSLHRARREIVVDALKRDGGFDAWLQKRSEPAQRTVEQMRSIVEGDSASVSRLTVAANLLADMARG